MFFISFCLTQNGKDITNLASSVSWSSNVSNLSDKLEFEIKIDDVYISTDIAVGDSIVLQNDDGIAFEGVVFDKNISNVNVIGISCYNVAIYLNESTAIKQFVDLDASACISSICNIVGLNIAEMPTLSTSINHIYMNDTWYKMIVDILEMCTNETNIIYYIQVNNLGLSIFERGVKFITPTFKQVSNVATIDSIKHMSRDFNLKSSISSMRNKVIVACSHETTYKTLAEQSDDSNISKYGLMQHIEIVDDMDTGQATNIAINKLKELNKVTESLSLNLLGHISINAGYCLTIKNDYFDGDFVILSAKHTLNNNIHLTSIDLERV